MFDSGIKASALIEQVKNEADIAIPIPYDSYVTWLNALEQLLYTEVIREQGKLELNYNGENVIRAEALKPEAENVVRFEDIIAVFADSTQLIASTITSGDLFPNTYYKKGNDIGLNLAHAPANIRITYLVKPELKTSENSSTKNVMLPVEFIDLAKAKLRGEAYKVANEGDLAAVWLNDYNVLLETFKMWISDKQPRFGQ